LELAGQNAPSTDHPLPPLTGRRAKDRPGSSGNDLQPTKQSASNASRPQIAVSERHEEGGEFGNKRQKKAPRGAGAIGTIKNEASIGRD
jgi:hypothetical protein